VARQTLDLGTEHPVHDRRELVELEAGIAADGVAEAQCAAARARLDHEFGDAARTPFLQWPECTEHPQSRPRVRPDHARVLHALSAPALAEAATGCGLQAQVAGITGPGVFRVPPLPDALQRTPHPRRAHCQRDLVADLETGRADIVDLGPCGTARNQCTSDNH